MDTLPKDPVMLMSFINTKLRDIYPNLDLLCTDLQVDRTWLEKTLKNAGFEYSDTNNKFW